jgi:hypothetical protein
MITMNNQGLALRDPAQVFEVRGLLVLRNETQSRTIDRVRAETAAAAVGITRNLRRTQNHGEFSAWLHVLTRPAAP